MRGTVTEVRKAKNVWFQQEIEGQILACKEEEIARPKGMM